RATPNENAIYHQADLQVKKTPLPPQNRSAPSASLLLALAMDEAAAPLSPGPRLLSAPRNASTTFLRFMPSVTLLSTLRMRSPQRMPACAVPPIDPVHGGLYHQGQL